MSNKKTTLLMLVLVASSVVQAWASQNETAVAAPAGESGQAALVQAAAPASLPVRAGKTADPVPASAGNTTVPAERDGGGEKSWWSALTDMLGLTSGDPGVTVQPVPSELATPSSEYIIGPGDMLGISVWRDENLTRSVVVLPDGKISFPLVGEMVAEGKTVTQLKTELEKALARYTADSVVTVEVKQSNSLIIYVTGRVKAPGRQMMVSNTNVLQALTMAGGLDPFATTGKIRIFRKHEGKTVMFAFNYDEVMQGRHLETNIELKRGDVIIVP